VGSGQLRPITAKMLLRYCGKTQREVANALGLSTGATVSVQLRRLKKVEISDPKIRKELMRLEEVLDSQPIGGASKSAG